MICQRFKNTYMFATLYDIKRRIPVYSAYTFSQATNLQRKSNWKIEPQLENIKEYENLTEMIDSPKLPEIIKRIRNQAVNPDYTNQGNITRGHLFPCMFAADQKQKDSTFTLTNIAPQTSTSNKLWEMEVEKKMLIEIKHCCTLDSSNRAYIVTGVIPGNNWLPIERNSKISEGINIPSHYWSAFFCTSKKNGYTARRMKAYIAQQEPFNIQQLNSTHALDKQLTELYKRNFQVFPGLNL